MYIKISHTQIRIDSDLSHKARVMSHKNGHVKKFTEQRKRSNRKTLRNKKTDTSISTTFYFTRNRRIRFQLNICLMNRSLLMTN